MATVVEASLLTAAEFGRRPEPGYPEELVRGEIVSMPPTGPRHGKVCFLAARLFGNFIEERDLGQVLTNDAGVITERDPDTARGPDLAYYSYDRLPRGPLAEGYGPETPDLGVEVRFPSERWGDLHETGAEYLKAGVRIVVVLDPDERSAHVFAAAAAPRSLGTEDELTLPVVLGDSAVAVRRFFP